MNLMIFIRKILKYLQKRYTKPVLSTISLMLTYFLPLKNNGLSSSKCVILDMIKITGFMFLLFTHSISFDAQDAAIIPTNNDHANLRHSSFYLFEYGLQKGPKIPQC